MKRHQTSLNYKVFKPFVNQVLFEKYETPEFNSNYEKLSLNYLNCRNSNGIDYGDNPFYINKIDSFISNLDENMRDEILEVILENNIYINGMYMIFLMDNNLFKKPDFRKYFFEFLVNLNKFRIDSQINKYIIPYFKVFFDQLFYNNLSLCCEISLKEYEAIFEDLSKNENFF